MEFRNELTEGRQRLLQGKIDSRLMPFLRSRYQERSETALMVKYIMEQGEDIFTFLIGDERLVTVEVSRIDREAPAQLLEEISVMEYLKKHPHTKSSRRKLEEAIALQREADTTSLCEGSRSVAEGRVIRTPDE